MQEALGAALDAFAEDLDTLRATLAAEPALAAEVFSGTEEWADLLTYKLVPHLAGEGCLVVAVTGGTNTGKSTAFNLLLGRDASPALSTAAATCRPLLAASPNRYRQCLETKLVPEFIPHPLERPEQVVSKDVPEDMLFVVEDRSLPDRIVLLDVPDIDSIELTNWSVAEHVRAAGDVLVAMLTGEKYKDERVVAFFRKAHQAGRRVLPVMNKANPDDDFDIARRQVADFCEDVGLDRGATPCFVLAHDFTLTKRFDEPIRSLEGGPDLRAYLETIDVPALKQQVYGETVRQFVRDAQQFLERLDETGTRMRQIVHEYEERARQFAKRYDPVPGAAVGGLFHEFVQRKRNPAMRAFGTASKTVAQGVSRAGQTVVNAFRQRATLERRDEKPAEAEIRRRHTEQLERITQDLATSYFASAQNLPQPLDAVTRRSLERLDISAAAAATVAQTLRQEDISEAFRAHAETMLNTWWRDHKGQRQALLALDAVLSLTPVAMAVPMGVLTHGFGVAELTLAAGGAASQFVLRVFEYQFGDQMFDFLSPWREEHQQAFAEALVQHVSRPALHGVHALLAPFEGDLIDDLKASLNRCRPA